MSDSVTIQSPLLRLPRELRDQIYLYAFSDYVPFPRDWSTVDKSDENALFRELPGLCQANRQLFYEASPIFLARGVTSRDESTAKQLLKLYCHFPDDAATKGVRWIEISDWTEESTAVQLLLISKFTKLRDVDATFTFPTMVDSIPGRYVYTNEQGIYWDTGLHYEPPPGRSIEEEKAVLAKDLEAFITKYSLDRVIEMPTLNSIVLRFGTNHGGKVVTYGHDGRKDYRHRLSNPLWRWAMTKLSERWEEEKFWVSTGFIEDYDGVNNPSD
ncbi:hypothetical protein BKA63DRAFT_492228 [Paraphoma chrysanthemicola]|nr:hypothetical protein BKA63DRAFT_492228 [Paraphoma chrysanthemicola]